MEAWNSLARLLDKVLLVMGHTSCGAIKGAIDNVELGNLTGLLAKIKPAVQATSYSGERTPRFRLVAFDLLAVGGDDIRSDPFHARIARLAKLLAKAGDASSTLSRMPKIGSANAGASVPAAARRETAWLSLRALPRIAHDRPRQARETVLGEREWSWLFKTIMLSTNWTGARGTSSC